jgi:hypothetical protein
MLLTDSDVREGLIGIPHYIHSMIAYACVFLLKVAAQYKGQYIDDGSVLEMTSKVVQQFRSTSVSKYHLVHLMANGLEKMASSKITSPSLTQQLDIANGVPPSGPRSIAAASTVPPVVNSNGHAMFPDNIGNGFEENFLLGTTPFLHFESGDIDYSFGGFGQ